MSVSIIQNSQFLLIQGVMKLKIRVTSGFKKFAKKHIELKKKGKSISSFIQLTKSLFYWLCILVQ